MSLTVTIGGTDVTDRVRLSDGYQSITSNADGTYAACGLKVDDPDSSLAIGRFQQVIIEESDCTARPRMFTGYVIEARPSRGPFRSGVERVWNLDVGDLNILLHTEAFHLANAKRPQETGTARRDWLLGTSPGSYFVNNGFFPTFAGLFDEADYRGQYADSVLATYGDIGRIGFLYWDDPDIAVYCAGANDGFATSSLSISNVLGDVNFTTVFPPDPAAELEIDMSEVYDEVYLTGPFGTYFAADHDGRLPSGIHRTGVFDLPRVGRLTTAASEAVTLLARYAGDVESITCTIQLPSDKVNLIDAGMLVPVKFSHLPGYSSGYVNLRAAQRTVNLAQVTDGSNLFYELTLKLNLRGVSVSGGGGGTFPHQTTCQPGSGVPVQANTATGFTNNLTVALSSPATDGNILVMGVTLRQQAFTGDPTGWTSLAEGEVDPFENNSKLYYKTAAAGDQTWTWVPGGGSGDASAVIAEFAGGVSFVDSAELVSTDPYTGPSAPGATVTPTSGSIATIVGFWGYKSDRATDPTADTGWTLTGTVKAGGLTRCTMAHKVVSSASGSYTPTIVAPDSQVVFDNHSYGAQSIAFSCTSSDNPPAPGQWTQWAEVAMSTVGGVSTGTTAFPYAAGSLEVKVQSQPILPTNYTETDNSTGDFALSWEIDPDEHVFVRYQGI